MEPISNIRQSGTFTGGAHEIHFPVYYEDTDAGGVVYYANYLRFAERGRTEALHLAGINHRDLMEEHGLWFVVRRCVVDYLKPARLDDIVTVRSSIQEMRTTSLVMRQEMLVAKETVAVVDAFVVCVGKTLRPSKIPQSVRDVLLAALPLHAPDTV
jgi:acyl-CoA thioester hydrolase